MVGQNRHLVWLIVAIPAFPAIAQTAPQATISGEQSRGVRILEAEPPAPVPAPAPVTPAEVVKPAQAVASERPALITPAANPPAPPASPPAPAPAPAPPPEPHPPAPQPVVAPAPPPMVIKPCPLPFAQADLRTDTSGFDRKLRGKLKPQARTVIVTLAAPYPASAEAPAPLGPWLNEVKASDGNVTVLPYCTQMTRGFFGKLMASLFGDKPKAPYKTARGYDAVLHANALDNVITQVEFVPRKPAQ